MTHSEVLSLAESWTNPISPEFPCGESARHDTAYEELLGEVRKLEAINRSEPNWAKIETLATQLLQHRTKDMSILGPLCLALLHTRQWSGLAAGLTAYHAMIAQWWPMLHPPESRLRGRAASYTWLTQNLAAALHERAASPTDREAIELCLQTFSSVDDVLRPHLGDLHPRVGEVKTALNDAVSRTVEKPTPPPAPPQSTTDVPVVAEAEHASPDSPTATVPTPSSSAINIEQVIEQYLQVNNAEDAARVLDHTLTGLRHLAQYHLRDNPRRSLGYHLASVTSFLGVVPDGPRSTAAPSPEHMSRLEQALSDGDADMTAGLVSEIMSNADLNLTAMHHLSQALKKLGGDYTDAYRALRADAFALWHRMNLDVEANPEATAWLHALPSELERELARRKISTTNSKKDDTPPIGSPDWMEATLTAAHALRRKRGLEAACQQLQNDISQAPAAATRFKLRLGLAQLCLDAEAPEFARPLLTDLQAELNQPLQSWETELTMELLRTSLQCNRELRKKSADDETLRREYDQLLSALARLNPAAAYAEQKKH